MKDLTRRKFIVAGIIAPVSGCLETTSVNSDRTRNSTQSTEVEQTICDELGDSSDQEASDKYRFALNDLGNASGSLGTTQTFERQWEAAFGRNSVFTKFDCNEAPCEERFLDSISGFRNARESAVDAKESFQKLVEMAKCDVRRSDFVKETGEKGVSSSENLIKACDHFIESAKTQIDEDNRVLNQGEDFEEGMEYYNNFTNISLPDADLFEKRLTVYAGENSSN